MPSNIDQQFIKAAKEAATAGHLEIIKLLIVQGANIHADNDEALRWFARSGHLEIVKFLVAQGGNIHANNDEALRNAASTGQFETVKFLILQGANIHADNDKALRGAAFYGHLETVKFLILQGANIHVNDDEVFKVAAENGNESISMLLNTILNKEKLLVAALGVMPVLPSASRCLCAIDPTAGTSGTALVSIAPSEVNLIRRLIVQEFFYQIYA